MISGGEDTHESLVKPNYFSIINAPAIQRGRSGRFAGWCSQCLFSGILLLRGFVYEVKELVELWRDYYLGAAVALTAKV